MIKLDLKSIKDILNKEYRNNEDLVNKYKLTNDDVLIYIAENERDFEKDFIDDYVKKNNLNRRWDSAYLSELISFVEFLKKKIVNVVKSQGTMVDVNVYKYTYKNKNIFVNDKFVYPIQLTSKTIWV